MATIHKLTKDGATIFPATITDAVVHPQTGKTLTSMMKDYNVSELFPTEGIDGGNKYNLALAIQVLGTHLSAAQKTGGIKLTFISSVSPYPEEEYYLSKSTWSGSAADWDQRFEVGDVVADPSGSWEPSTAQQYIDQQIAGVNTNLTSEVIARQMGDRNLQTNLTSEMNTRASQDANLNALINAGIREGGGVQFDIVPTQNSANGITSGGMYSTLKDSNIGFVDNVPTAGSDSLVKSGGVFEFIIKNNSGIFHRFESNSEYVLKVPVEGEQKLAIIITNIITFSSGAGYRYYAESFDSNDSATVLFIKEELLNVLEFKTLSSTKYIKIYIKGNTGHQFNLRIYESPLLYDKKLGSNIYGLVLKEIKFDENKYDISLITGIGISLGAKIYASKERYYVGLFIEYNGTYIFLTSAYSSKTEAVKNARSGYYNMNGVEFIVDYDFMKFCQFDYLYITQGILSVDQDKQKRIFGSNISLVNDYSSKTAGQIHNIAGSVSEGIYIQWEKKPYDVFLNKVLFSGTSESDVNIDIIVFDESLKTVVSLESIVVGAGDTEVNINNLCVPKNCFVGLKIPQNTLFGYTIYEETDSYTRLSCTVPASTNISTLTLDTLELSESNYNLGVGFLYFDKYNGNELCGKKVLCIGDSVTWMGYYTEELQKRTGCLLYNRGIDGTTVAKYINTQTSAFVERADLPTNDNYNDKNKGFPSESDYVLILGGINDWAFLRRGYDFVLGDKYAANNKSTFCGAWKYLLSSVKSKYPSAKIYTMLFYDVCNPNVGTTYRHGEVNLTNGTDLSGGLTKIEVEKDGVNISFDKLRQEIAEISTMYGVECIDLRNSGFSAFNNSDRQKYYEEEIINNVSVGGDGLHINRDGAKLVVDYLLNKLGI